jgi:hypothetical protein
MVSPNTIVPGASYRRTSMCALVLEDNPVGDDSRLAFESFPQRIEQSYSLAPYKTLGGNRMPQPAFAVYDGGNWNPIPLELTFIVGGITAPVGLTAANLSAQDFENLYIDLEGKVNWTEAICFPLERANTSAQRIVANAAMRNPNQPAIQQASIAASKLKRNDPPFVLLVFGAWRIIRGYCTGWSCSWEGPWHPIAARPGTAHVKMTFMPIMPVYPTWQSIRNQAGQTGTTQNNLNQPVLQGTVLSASMTQSSQDSSRAAANLAARAPLVAAATSRATPFEAIAQLAVGGSPATGPALNQGYGPGAIPN